MALRGRGKKIRIEKGEDVGCNGKGGKKEEYTHIYAYIFKKKTKGAASHRRALAARDELQEGARNMRERVRNE